MKFINTCVPLSWYDTDDVILIDAEFFCVENNRFILHGDDHFLLSQMWPTDIRMPFKPCTRTLSSRSVYVIEVNRTDVETVGSGGASS